MSFLDCICCGFGAIILLLVLKRIRRPDPARAGARPTWRARSRRCSRNCTTARHLALVLERELRGRIEQLSEEQKRVARLRGDLSTIRGKDKASIVRRGID